jgi:hypothetical protein
MLQGKRAPQVVDLESRSFRCGSYEPYMDAPRLQSSLFVLAGQVKIAAIYPAFG